MPKSKFIKFFDELTIKDVPSVGGKNASLGEMYQKLGKKGVHVPYGFATTAYAYNSFMEETGLKKKIREILKGLNTHNVTDLARRGQAVRQAILKQKLSPQFEKEILKAYTRLSKKCGVKNVSVAVRSSATAEDLPDASFAGQQDTYLNIVGPKDLLQAVKECVASLFTNRAISYRVDKKFDHFNIALSVGVQKMVRSDLASSGVMFSIDTESGFDNVVLINSIYGLGENIVQGKVTPDEFFVFKPTMKIISRTTSTKKIKMIYAPAGKGKNPVKDVPVPEAQQNKPSIADVDVITLAKWAVIIHKHYGRPMDMEWAIDGQENKLYIVQARPETIHSMRDHNVVEEYRLSKHGKVLVQGRSVGNKIGVGVVNKIMDAKDISKFKKGQVLVTDMTDPDWEPIMKIASAIITDKGGRTCFGGETNILTNKGFILIKDITKKLIDQGIYTPSLNRSTLKIEWKKITDVISRNSQTIKINVSQTGHHQDNYLVVTPDHKFITLHNRTLIDKEITKIIQDKDMILAADKLSAFDQEKISKELAYLWGCIYTDGSISLSRTHGEVQFIQKPTPEKEQLIKTVNKYFYKLFNKHLSISIKQTSSGSIRGKQVIGSANAYRCYSKEVATKFTDWQKTLSTTMLNCDPIINYYFLAGIIDGDGTFNHKSNKINIFCSKEYLLQAIVISCLKLNILPQVSNNRHIYNVQIVERIDDILHYCQRVKGKDNRTTNGVKLLSAKQLFADIASLVNFKGRINSYIRSNALIDKVKIKEQILPMLKGGIKKIVTDIIQADLVSMRAVQFGGQQKAKVYNITVEDNHNYLVFTSKYTPVVVNNCHAAIISREMGIPCIVGTNNGSHELKSGDKVTVSCAEGDEGFVYKGISSFKINKTSIKNMARPKTQIMMNIGTPDTAFAQSFIPNDGVGLAREEFIIANYIKIHPLALLNYKTLKDAKAKKQIDELTAGYKDKSQYYIDRLAEGIALIAAAFYPKPVIVRLSDFKTNEYANLIGGPEFEPIEANPMIGWRGASRYYDPKYAPAFALECKAFYKARHDMGLKNIKIMVPICRTVEEGKKVIGLMAKYGLRQHQDQLDVYVMAEVPVNIILAEEFCKVFDGFSIGSNDLTQFTLAIDRDAGHLKVAGVSNENNESVKTLIKFLIQAAHKHGKKVGICGQAPSDFPEFARYLVHCGIDSISLNPDTVIKTTIDLVKTEKRLKNRTNK